MTLVEYMARLDSTDTKTGVYVDPLNVDDFVVSSKPVKGKVYFGDLETISYNVQSERDAFNKVAWNIMYPHMFDQDALYKAYKSMKIDSKLRRKFKDKIRAVKRKWAYEGAKKYLENFLQATAA